MLKIKIIFLKKFDLFLKESELILYLIRRAYHIVNEIDFFYYSILTFANQNNDIIEKLL